VLKVRRTLVVGSGEGVTPFEQMFSEYRVQTPGTENLNGQLDFLFVETAGRRRNPNGISGAEAGGLDHDDGFGLK
jgi:hypothetical protein